MDFTVGFVSQNLVAQKKICRISRQSNLFNFRGIGCPMNPKNGIFEKINLESEK